LHKSLHARDEIDGIDRGGVAGRVEMARDFLLERKGDGNLPRRRSRVTVIAAAGGKDQGGDDRQRRATGPGFRHERTPSAFALGRNKQRGRSSGGRSDFGVALARRNGPHAQPA